MSWWLEAKHCDLLNVERQQWTPCTILVKTISTYLNISRLIRTYLNLSKAIQSSLNLSKPIQTYPNLFVLIWTYPKISKSIFVISKTQISQTKMETQNLWRKSNVRDDWNTKRALTYKATISVRSLSMQRCVINRKSLLWLPSPTLPFLYLLFWKSNGKKWSRSSRNIRNPSIYTIIRWFSRQMGQMTRWSNV